MKSPRRLAEVEHSFAPCWVCGSQPIVEYEGEVGHRWFRARCPNQDPDSFVDEADDLQLLKILWSVNNRPEDQLLI